MDQGKDLLGFACPSFVKRLCPFRNDFWRLCQGKIDDLASQLRKLWVWNPLRQA